jgi:plastocyanin domain-containing protein
MNVYRQVSRCLAVATAGLVAGSVALHASPAPPDPTAAVERVEIQVTARGFVPAEIELVAGIPVELVFVRTTASGCTSHVHIPGLGVEKTMLPEREPVVISITPQAPGSYELLCGMNMLRGTIRVRQPA